MIGNIKKLSKIGKQYRQTFGITAILMIIVHFYAFSNMIVNHDCVNSILGRESTEHYIELGRWAILPFLKISADPVMPAVIGMLSTLYIAVAATLLVSLWEVKSGVNIFLICFSLCSFPVLANTFCYMYTADAYFAALLLAVLYAWLMKKNMLRYFIPGIVIITVVCGIYQAYWCFGMVLIFATLFLDYVYGKDTFATFIKKIVVTGINLAISLGVYYGIARIVQLAYGLEFSSYQDMDRLGKFGSIKEIYWYAREAYHQFIEFFLVDGGFLSDWRLVGLNIIIMGILIICLAVSFYRKKRAWYEQIVFWVLTISIPLIINGLSVISRNRLWPVMMIAFVVPYLLAVVCCDRNSFFNCGGIRILCCISVVAIAWMNYLTTNRIYVRMELAYEATFSYLTKMTMRLEECPGYDHDTPVAFINESDIENGNELNQVRIFAEDFPAEMSVFDDLNSMRDVDTRTMIRNELDIVDFCQAFLGFKLEILPNEERICLYDNKEVQEMPVYPQKGSTLKIDGQIVVKLPG